MSLLRKKMVLAAKLESTIGTAESLAAADADYNVYDIEIDPEADEQARASQGSASKLPTTIGARMVNISFKVEMHGSGTVDTDPEWASVFLPALGFI